MGIIQAGHISAQSRSAIWVGIWIRLRHGNGYSDEIGRIEGAQSMSDIEPCAECGRPAKTVAGPGSLISIGCFRTGCRCVPVTYWVGNNRSRSAAIRSWNFRWKKKHPDAAIENYEEVA